jgi:hypothetical protein
VKKARTLTALAAVGVLATVAACSSDADMASQNLSKAAEQFEVQRRVVFINGITDEYLLTIEGKCSIEDDGGQLEVTCKIGPDDYEKHFLGLSDNVTYVAEQLETVDVSEFHSRVIFKPESIVPDIDVETSAGGED